jgi:hypothetical protein
MENKIEKLAAEYAENGDWDMELSLSNDGSFYQIRVEAYLAGYKASSNQMNALLKEIAISLRNGGYGDDTEFGRLYKKLQSFE